MSVSFLALPCKMRACQAQATVRALPKYELATQAFSRSSLTKGASVCQPTGPMVYNCWTTVKHTRGPRGYDAGKKVSGRKRHIVVDTLGLLLAVVVHAANIQDRDGAKLVLSKLVGRFPKLKLIWADAGYAGQLVEWVRALGG